MTCATAELYEFLKQIQRVKKYVFWSLEKFWILLRIWYVKCAESIKLILYYIEQYFT